MISAHFVWNSTPSKILPHILYDSQRNCVVELVHFPTFVGVIIDYYDGLCHRPLSRRLDRCDRVIQDEVGDSNGGNV